LTGTIAAGAKRRYTADVFAAVLHHNGEGLMLFCAKFEVLLDLLLKHRHFYLPRYPKLVLTVLFCLLLQRAISKEEKLYEEQIKGVEIVEDPVFIIGHWRSGTTYLHYLMSLDTDNFAYPTNYQCFFPTIYLTFNEKSWLYKVLNKLMGVRTRVIDNMELGLHLPQEDEWMYLPEGGSSYILEKLIFPQTAVTDHDKIMASSIDAKAKAVTLKIFKKLTYVYHKRILSKSPGHFSRIPALKELFPDSRFLFIVRHPYDVVLSMMHARKILGRMLSLQKADPDGMMSVAEFVTFYFDVMNECMQLLKLHEYVLVRYEDIVREPLKSIQSIYNSLGFPYTHKYEDALTQYLKSVKDYKRNRFDINPETKELIYGECQRIFAAYGYEK
jgi:omega-hydroxy-beta-dihydromenaquinone-9 sulfotransferase